MRQYKKRLMKYFDEIIAGSFALAAAGFLFAGMSSRIFFRREVLWTEEAAMLCFVWSVFLGIASVCKREVHVGADMLIRMIPKKYSQWITALERLLLVGINAWLFWLSIEYMITAVEQRLPELGISCAWMGAAMVTGFGLSTWYSCGNLLYAEKRNRGKGEA